MSGSKYECPVCGGHFRALLPYGVKGRSNALCPKCLSLERHRLIWLYLKAKTDFFTAPKKMLHIAPEQAFYKVFKKLNNLNYVTADLESPLADIKLDIKAMPLENESFDVVMCNHVLEHIDDDRLAMSEVYRVLRKGGFAILQVPMQDMPETYEDATITEPLEREKHFLQKDHVRIYGRDYGKRLRSVGFEVIEDDFVKHIDATLLAKYCLPVDEIIYFCEK